jgi:hypothetical protein
VCDQQVLQEALLIGAAPLLVHQLLQHGGGVLLLLLRHKLLQEGCTCG